MHLLAAIISPSKKACNTFHTISYIVPTAQGQQNRSHMVVLHSVSGTALRNLERIFPELKERLTRQCDDFSELQPGVVLPSVYTHRGIRYENLDPRMDMHTVDLMPSYGVSELRFSRIRIHPSFPAEYVKAIVAQFARQPIEIHAYDSNGNEVGNATSPNIPKTEHILEVRGQDIVELIVSGGEAEGVLLEICFGRKPTSEPCYYYGQIVLNSFDPIGPWRTYLFVQTINDIAEGTNPDDAAQTIGGLPVTRNFEYVGEGSKPPYGEGCIFRPFVDGNFNVV